MNTKKFRKMNRNELETELDEKRKELADLRFDIKSGSETDYAQIRELKKEIARIFTVINSGNYNKEASKKSTKK